MIIVFKKDKNILYFSSSVMQCVELGRYLLARSSQQNHQPLHPHSILPLVRNNKNNQYLSCISLCPLFCR